MKIGLLIWLPFVLFNAWFVIQKNVRVRAAGLLAPPLWAYIIDAAIVAAGPLGTSFYVGTVLGGFAMGEIVRRNASPAALEEFRRIFPR